MIHIILGAPGAGKGTQGDLLEKHLGFTKLSTGDVLRKNIREGTALGKEVDGIIKAGKLVPDEIMLKLLRQELEKTQGKQVLLDGYPRNVQQARSLEELEKKFPIDGVIHLDVPKDVLLRRLSGRRVCRQCASTFHVDAAPPAVQGVCDRCGGALEQRPDDQPASVEVRLKVFDEATAPLVSYYKQKGQYAQVSGEGKPEEIFSEIRGVVLAQKGEMV